MPLTSIWNKYFLWRRFWSIYQLWRFSMKAMSGLKSYLENFSKEKSDTYFPDSDNAGPVYESSIFISLKSGKGSSVFSSPNKDKITHKSLYNIRCTVSKNIVPFRLILSEVKKVKGHLSLPCDCFFKCFLLNDLKH